MSHVPLRHCAVCRREGAKSEMIRVVRLPDGTWHVDEAGKLNGRGAYLCNNPACIGQAVKKRALNRSFREAVPEEIYRKLADDYGN